jgi:hypothetical protein
MAPTAPPLINPSLRTNGDDDGAAGALASATSAEKKQGSRALRGPKVSNKFDPVPARRNPARGVKFDGGVAESEAAGGTPRKKQEAARPVAAEEAPRRGDLPPPPRPGEGGHRARPEGVHRTRGGSGRRRRPQGSKIWPPRPPPSTTPRLASFRWTRVLAAPQVRWLCPRRRRKNEDKGVRDENLEQLRITSSQPPPEQLGSTG